MEFFEVLRKRRSVRRFQDKPVPRELVERLLEAAFLSPSSFNKRPWHFIVIDDREKLKALSKAKLGAAGLATAPLAIVVTADESRSDVWVEDASIAAEHIQLAAFDLGLGSFWVQIRNRMHDEGKTAEDYVRELLDIPPNYRVLCIVGIGYPAEKKPPHGDEVFEPEKVSRNSFGKPWK
ncbi:nitroreductase family protein [Thermococcus celer]|uniref:NAD(P)H nitroreductase n=1 Tax=Thermococcus celer Vu 13 = JCM 8558 TaxID=1293037 RepID=A0A218P0X5_THECE|nr:nitroreductase family protein [Thermococcus celer]ASI98565.1 NAD(P)H nitroreductase [Thermococcus celer Vu 13 = JCM 8558]